MKHTLLTLMILAAAATIGTAHAATVWQDDCSSLTPWGEASNSNPEEGDAVGGIQVQNWGFTVFQMNSWWGSPQAGWTNMWRNTGILIQPNADYTLTLRMASFASGAAVTLNLQNASVSPWSTITEQSVSPAGDWADRTISFSTVGGANAAAVGGQIAIGVAPGWWNNLAIRQFTLDETIYSGPINPSPAHDTNPNDDLNAVGEPSTISGKVKVQLAWDTMKDPNNPTVVYSKVTKHYLYFKAGDPNFVGMTPVEIPAGSPIIARPTYLEDNLNFNGIYYWQVKESIDGSAANSPNTVPGPIWAFETIQESPVIITSPTDIIVETGSPAAFTAQVVSNSPITCKWYLSDDKANNTAPDTLLDTTTVSTCTIPSTPITYAGKYVYCEVSNASPTKVLSSPALLEVKRLIGWWKMDNDLTDSSGNNWNGMYTLPTVTYAVGQVGNAVSLPKDPNHITVVDTEDAFNFYHLGMTVNVWVKNATPAWGTVLSKEDRTGDYEGWELTVTWQGYPAFSIVGGGPSSGNATLNVCDDQWHLLTGVYDPATRIASIYVDGELKSSGNPGSTTIAMSPAPLMIGCLLADGNTPFGGLIDDVRIYTYPKLNTQVLDLYNEVAEPDKKLCILSYDTVADINGDCKVNLSDFAAMASGWLTCGLYPNCQ